MEKNRKATKTKDIEKKKANQKTKEKKTKKKEKAKETAKATTKTSTTKTKTTKTKTTKKAQKVVTKATSLRDALPVSSSLETSHKTTSRLRHQSKGEMETMEVIRMPGDYILYFQYVVSSKAGRFQCKKETSSREKWRRIH